MTAWFPIILLLTVMGKCALSFLELEYGTSACPLTESDYFYVAMFVCAYAMYIDAVHFLAYLEKRKKRHGD